MKKRVKLVSFFMLVIIFFGFTNVKAESLTDKEIVKLKETAATTIGAPYNHGTATIQDGFECDSLIYYIFKESIGFNVVTGKPSSIAEHAKEITKADLRPGDLQATAFDAQGNVTHLQLYLGEIAGYNTPQIIHAAPGGGVQYLDYERDEKAGMPVKYYRIYGEMNTKIADWKITDYVGVFEDNYYVSKELKIDTLNPGTIISDGIEYGNFIRYIYKGPVDAYIGKPVFVPKNYCQAITTLKPYTGPIPENIAPEEPVQEIPVEEKGVPASGYTTASVNIRSASSGEIISKFKMGKFLYGEKIDNKLHFDFNGQKATITLAYFKEAQPSIMYVTNTANIRNDDFNIVGKAYRGKEIKAVLLGKYYRYWDNGVKLVFNTYVSSTKPAPVQVSGYTNASVNIRDARTNEVIGQYRIGKYLVGLREGSYLYFDYNGRKAKIVLSLFKIAPAYMRTITAHVNVRNDGYEVVGSKKPGEQIKAVRLGNYYRFWDNGVKLVYYAFVK